MCVFALLSVARGGLLGVTQLQDAHLVPCLTPALAAGMHKPKMLCSVAGDAAVVAAFAGSGAAIMAWGHYVYVCTSPVWLGALDTCKSVGAYRMVRALPWLFSPAALPCATSCPQGLQRRSSQLHHHSSCIRYSSNTFDWYNDNGGQLPHCWPIPAL